MAIQTQNYTAHTTPVQNPRLRLLNTLRKHELALMTFIAIPSVRHAQIVAMTGLDVRNLDVHNSTTFLTAAGRDR